MAKGFVYFCGYRKEVKIGKSAKPSSRIAQLNGANPEEVKLYVFVETADMGNLENQLHQHFRYCRKPGKREWYTLNHELRFIIGTLSIFANPSELQLGVIMGQYHAYQNPVADNPTLHRHSRSLELREQELWALSYAVRSLGMHNYPAFQERYNEARQLIAPLTALEAPLFIRKGNEPLRMEVAEIETDPIPLVNINDSADSIDAA